MGTKIVETPDLTVFYGRHRGIVDVNLLVEKGEVFGFLGPNMRGREFPHLMASLPEEETERSYRDIGINHDHGLPSALTRLSSSSVSSWPWV
jgi:ABC-type uncharacterized transport system ATPase subunit